MKTTLILCLILPFLTSCAQNTPVQTKTEYQIIDTACKWVRLIYVSKSDIISSDTARAILAHNRAVDANCNAK